MAFYDSEKNKIIHFPSRNSKHFPGWEEIDCGCCAGIKWGGEYPKECDICGGNGIIFKHKKSGVLAEYPGGKFLGREPKKI